MLEYWNRFRLRARQDWKKWLLGVLIYLAGRASDTVEDYVKSALGLALQDTTGKVGVFEGGAPGVLIVDLLAPAGNTANIDQFFFEFAVVGSVVSAEKFPYRVGGCDVTWNWKNKAGDQVTAETISITCHDMLPGGYFTTYVTYEPLKQKEVTGIPPELGLPVVYEPVMPQVRNYPGFAYTWSYKGDTQRETKCADLTGLAFVKEANRQELLTAKIVQRARTLKAQGGNIAFFEVGTPQYPSGFDDAMLDKRERERCKGGIDFQPTVTPLPPTTVPTTVR